MSQSINFETPPIHKLGDIVYCKYQGFGWIIERYYSIIRQSNVYEICWWESGYENYQHHERSVSAFVERFCQFSDATLRNKQ